LSSELIKGIWSIAEVLTDRLKAQMGAAKAQEVLRLTNHLETVFGAEFPEEPTYIHVRAALERYVLYQPDDAKVKNVRFLDLAKATKASENADGNLEPFASLAYDWRADKRLRRMYGQPPRHVRKGRRRH